MLQLVAPTGGRIARSRRPAGGRTGGVKTLLALVHTLEPLPGRSVKNADQLMREQERKAERARILRDMHDGVGSHISTAIRQLQMGKASREEVLHTLGDALDHLKLSIDAMNQPPGDINALLANLRYRLEPRFLACGIPWDWQVDPLQPMARVDSGAMRQLQFMLMEALSNVLQHSQASKLCIAAHAVDAQGRGVQLQIIDNGLGFDVSRPKRKGLLSMQERADAIGVALRLSSAPGRTVVEITVACDTPAGRTLPVPVQAGAGPVGVEMLA